LDMSTDVGTLKLASTTLLSDLRINFKQKKRHLTRGKYKSCNVLMKSTNEGARANTAPTS
jgi:hypothetical protein